MKRFLFLAPVILTASCSLLGGKPDAPSGPVVREKFNPCPFMVDGVNHPNCPKGEPKGKGICMPSGELHSVPEKCDKIK